MISLIRKVQKHRIKMTWKPRNRSLIEKFEEEALSPFAQLSSESAGRKHSEPSHPFRTVYQRDRARIIHSKAFRRLEYKTQVFLNGTGDHLRTRLTHTIEVSSVSRTIATALGVNQDLTEAIALAHDLGHPPFGHSGEKKLNELMVDHGGFEHNNQSLRTVELLENLYPNFDGLNLSYEVLEGIMKHSKGFNRPSFKNKIEETFKNPSIEAQIANLADEITYYAHDLDDGLDFNLINEDQLIELDLWQRCVNFVDTNYKNLKGKRRRAYIIRNLLDFQVADIIKASTQHISEQTLDSSDQVRRSSARLIRNSKEVTQSSMQLKRFLYENLYNHKEVAQPNKKGGEIISSVFELFIKKPSLLGETTSKRISEHGLHRTVCDYIAGMTDRYIIEEFDELMKS